jgi:hypothetical protein
MFFIRKIKKLLSLKLIKLDVSTWEKWMILNSGAKRFYSKFHPLKVRQIKSGKKEKLEEQLNI